MEWKPEISRGTEFYGNEENTYNSDLELNKTVEIDYDVQCSDRLVRTHGYYTVFLSEINSELVSRGYAGVLYIPPNGESRLEEFQALELDARDARRGLWGNCDPLPPAGT